MNLRFVVLRAVSAVVAFGSFAWFLCLVGTQVYRWLRDGEWTRIGIGDGLLSLMSSCCVTNGGGATAQFVRWLEAPQSWLGWHRVLEVVPASIGLFLLSVLGNFIFIYCSDRLDGAAPVPSDE